MDGTRTISRLWLHTSAAMVFTAALSGCMDSAARERMAEKNSILAGLIDPEPTPADAALWASDPNDPDKRVRGVLLLANAPFGGDDVYVERYRQLVTDDVATVRAASARALGLRGQPEDVPRLIPLLQDKERIVRIETAKAMQRLHNPAATPPLLERLTRSKESESDVRAEAATALGQYAQPRVLEGLIAALDDDNYIVVASANQSLRTLTGQDFPDDRKQWIDWRRGVSDPFAARRPYQYPIFERDRRWLDYLPFAKPAQNEQPGQPTGMPQE